MEEEKVLLKIVVKKNGAHFPLSFTILSSGEIWHQDRQYQILEPPQCEHVVINVGTSHLADELDRLRHRLVSLFGHVRSVTAEQALTLIASELMNKLASLI